MKASRTIRRQVAQLRQVVDQSNDPTEQKLAFAMEHALRWASLNTSESRIDKDAVALARTLRRELVADGLKSN